MIKVILFDVDGVILFPLTKYFSVRLSELLGLPIEKILPFFDGPYKACMMGKLDLKEALAPYLAAWNWTGTMDELLEFWFEAEADVDKELIACIDTLREQGVVCLIATNQEKYRAEYMFQKIGFNKSFDKLYAAGNLGVAKPDHAFFQTIVDDLKGVAKEEILFWDDQLKNVESAREYGIHAEQYTTLPDFENKMHNYISV